MLLGWGAVVAVALSGPLLRPPLPAPLLVIVLAVAVNMLVHLLITYGVV